MRMDRLDLRLPVCLLLALSVSMAVTAAQAPTSPPVPTLRCAEMQAFLKTAKIGPQRGIPVGVLLPSRAPLDDGKLRHEGAIQTTDISKTTYQTSQHLQIGIFSSGSALAQQLLFDALG